MLADPEWLAEMVGALPESVDLTWPSQWAEDHRRLDATVTSTPGRFSFDLTPYLREIVDAMDPRVPVREVAVKKGAQVGFTVGVLENVIGWGIGHLQTAPMMFLSATDDLVKLRMDDNVTKMLQQSGLEDRIASTDEISKRKSGKTNKRVTWIGGGFLLPVGAKSAAKLRSVSIRYILGDEVDGYPEVVGPGGKEGDPVALAERRTGGFEETHKKLWLSTPLDMATSRIEKKYQRGDQRKYMVPCIECGKYQDLRFNPKPVDGVVYGLTWEMEKDGETLVPGSVRYLCRYCQHPHTNANKALMLQRGRWQATAKPAHPSIRSYHLSALYSPPGMFSWESCVMMWLEAWDVAQNRSKDVAKLKTFYNTVLGEPFEDRGSKLTLASVSRHRRSAYKYGEIPNTWMREHAGGPAGLLVGAVDVHGHNLRVGVFAFTPGERMFLIDHHTLVGVTEDANTPDTWGKLAEIIEKDYTADDGRTYSLRHSLTFIDSGYNTDAVYDFCSEWTHGVYPVAGRDRPAKNQLVPHFRQVKTKRSGPAFHITVDLYKDQLSEKLKRKWDGEGVMPEGHFNAPAEVTDAHLKELTIERKQIRFDPRTNHRLGWAWVRPHANARNELWDLSVYARAALDVLAFNQMVEVLEQPHVHMPDFWAHNEAQAWYWRPPK